MDEVLKLVSLGVSLLITISGFVVALVKEIKLKNGTPLKIF